MKRLFALIAVFTIALTALITIQPEAQAVTYTPGSTNSFKNLAANATTTVKTGAGTLDSIIINTVGASANTITVYDNTAGSGTKIATVDGTIAGGTRIIYNCAFTTGLTIVIATGTAANITVVYR